VATKPELEKEIRKLKRQVARLKRAEKKAAKINGEKLTDLSERTVLAEKESQQCRHELAEHKAAAEQHLEQLLHEHAREVEEIGKPTEVELNDVNIENLTIEDGVRLRDMFGPNTKVVIDGLQIASLTLKA